MTGGLAEAGQTEQGEPAAGGPLLPSWIEAVGVLGAVFAVSAAAALLQFGDREVAPGQQKMLAGTLAAAFLAGGWLLRSSSQPAVSRLAGILWLFSVAGIYWLGTTIVGASPGRPSTTGTIVAAGATCAYAALLWALRRRPAQVVGLWASSAILTWTVLSDARASTSTRGVTIALLGVAWFLVGRVRLVRPEGLTSALGGALLVAAPLVAFGHRQYVYEGIVAVLLAALSVPLRQTSLLVVGCVAAFAATLLYSFERFGTRGISNMRTLLIAGIVAAGIAVGCALVLAKRTPRNPTALSGD